MRSALHPLILVAFSCLTEASTAQVNTQPRQQKNNAGMKPEKNLNSIGKAHSWDFYPDIRASFNFPNVSEDGQQISKETIIRGGVGSYYFFTDHWAAGLGFDLNSTHSSSANPTIGTATQTTWSLNPGIEYGFNFSPGVGMYLRASVGVGDYKISGSTPTGSYLNKESTFSFGGQLGFPILLQEESPVRFTPFISYWNTKYSYSGGNETNGVFGVGVRLESFMGCSDFVCDSHHGYNLSRNAFQAGQNFFSYGNGGSLRFGSENATYSGGSLTGSKIDFFDDCFDICYGHFVIPNLALGAEVNIRGTSDSYQGADQKESTSSWQIGPIVEFHPFEANGLNNFAIKGGVGFGTDKSTSTFPGTTGTSTSSITENYFGYHFGVAYVDYFASSIAVVPEIGYRGSSYKYSGSSTNGKETYDGLFFGWGIRYSF